MARILIVEDSATQAEKLQLTLSEGGFESVIAGDAVAAMQALRAADFDLVISDIVMPGESGYDLCRQIKSRSEWRTMPVVLLTTRRDPMDIFKGLECGADNFYTKPYEPGRLLDRVRNLLHNRQLRAEGKLRLGVEVSMFGKTFTIGAERGQILDMLISTFEDIVESNVALEETRDQLRAANAKLDRYVRTLEGRVQSSEDLYRAVFENISDGILLLDSHYVVTSANPAARKMFAASAREDLVDLDCRSLVSASTGAADSSSALPPPGKGVRGIGRKRDGGAFPLTVAMSELMLDEQRVLVALVHDLSAEQAAQE